MAILKRGQLYVNETTGKIHYYGFPSGGGGIAWHEAASTWDGSTVSAGTITTLTTTTVNGTTLNGTLGTAAQPNVTSLGTLIGLNVDSLTLNGATISSSTGAISFSNEDLTTTGDISCADVDATSVDVDGSANPVSAHTQTASSGVALKSSATHASYAAEMTQFVATRAASSGFKFLATRSGAGADIEHNLRGDGNAYADGTWNGGGADFAEYMEWQDGNLQDEDRTGMTVALVPNDDGKIFIKIADADDQVIGVVSAHPTIIGNNDWNKWHLKHERDSFGRYQVNDNGERIVSSDYDDSLEHESREDRQEWSAIGLVGLVVIRDDQQTASNWIRIGTVADGLSRWLIK